MAILANQPLHCPACGTVVSKPVALNHVLSLCCDDDCREAMRQAHARHILGKQPEHGQPPFREMMMVNKDTAGG